MTRYIKEKVNENIQVNFNVSKEVTYWATKYGITTEELKRIFESTGNSISATIQAMRQYNQAGLRA